MLDPFDYKNKHLAARLGRTRLRTLVSLIAERLTAVGWRISTWAGFFAGLWLFQIQTLFGVSGAVSIFLLFIAGVFYFIWKDARHFHWPQAGDIDRRIEQESALRHRPLAAMQDSLANPQRSNTRRLWEEGRIRLTALLGIIRHGKPKAFMAARDPYAARLGVLLFFALGIYAAGPAWNERIYVGLTPLRFSNGAESPDRLSLWVTPPAYTGLQPLVIKGNGDGNVINIPAGSTLKITVRGGAGVPRLVVTGKDNNLAFAETDEGNFILEAPVPPGHVLNVKQGFFTRAAWPYEIVPDRPPLISVKDGVEVTHDGPMRFPLEVEDDYGVKNVIMDVTLNQSMSGSPLGEPVNESRVVMSPPETKMPIQPVYDLTAHAWAGQPVSITFSAEDGMGQKVAAEPVIMTLPERPFAHPIAKKLIEIRKRLILKPESDYKVLTQEIELLMVRPGLYLDDKTVFLALRAAASHLYWADPPSRKDAIDVVDLLWDVALRVEGGEISIAARNLRDAQRALEKALENPDTTQEEIQKLMSDLRGAMTEYFMEMAREMQKRMAEGQEFPMMSPEMMARTIDPESLANFMEQLEARMMAGDKKAAQEMMAQLQRLMDMMDPSMAAPMPEDMQMMSEGINELQQLIDRQKDLLAQTQSQSKSLENLKNEFGFGEKLQEENFPDQWKMDDMPPAPETPAEPPSIVMNTSQHRTEQEALRIMLGTLMQEAGEVLDEIPENMGMAEQEMRGSSAALGENNPAGSIPHQETALEHLQQSQKQLSQQFAARMQQMIGFSMMGGGMKFDPLGRPYGGDGKRNGLFGSPVKIPDEAERKKAQEILKLLRNRSGELERPDEELDYYKRLLRQF
jgi:uncharacterized protein (TIGR02302 family)